jgi:hypothetical protein
MKKGEKMGKKKTYLLKNKNLDRFNFSFPFVWNVKQVPPLAQGNGWGNTSPWHMQHNEPRTTMQ